MLLVWLNNNCAVLNAKATEINLQVTIDMLLDSNINTFITINKYDYRICWSIGEGRKIRRYFNTFGDLSNPSLWEISNLLHFIKYETENGYKTAIWIADLPCRENVLNDIESWSDNGTIPKVNLPKSLHYCSGCSQKCCLTELVCHTSSVDDSKKIFVDNKLKSAIMHRQLDENSLHKEERNAAGDHPDYFDYVMFNWGNCGAGQRLVNERRLGHIPSEEELINSFVPGVTFYFATQKIFEHSNYMNDGYHAAKVKHSLDLEKYLLALTISSRQIAELLPLISESIIEKVIVIEDINFHEYSRVSYEKVIQKLRKA